MGRTTAHTEEMGNAKKLQSVKLKQIKYSLGELHTDGTVKMK
jgi:hypothetical protein